MFVCLCHAITDREIRRHCDDSAAHSVSGIYQACGVKPKCGKCVSTVCEMLRARKSVTVLPFDTMMGQAAIAM